MLRILIVDDDETIHNSVGNYLRESGHKVGGARDGDDGLAKARKGNWDLVISDIEMPGMDGVELLGIVVEEMPELSVIIVTGHGTLDRAVAALRLGALDFLQKPVRLDELERVLAKARACKVSKQCRPDKLEELLVGSSPQLAMVREDLRKAVHASCDTVLVVGETGSGKEVVARGYHLEGGSDRPFVAVSCPTIPDTLIERELFGHEKGAFTGADQAGPGYFELANGGVLFLDEIADLGAAAQASLLRVLETRTLRRVGGTKEVAVRVSVVAATNAPLEDLVEEGRFRRDLYFRLTPFTIQLPPLRERPEDLEPLIEHFMRLYAASRRLPPFEVTASARDVLAGYAFPGNARELRSLIEGAAMRCGGTVIAGEHVRLPRRVLGGGFGSSSRPAVGSGPAGAASNPSAEKERASGEDAGGSAVQDEDRARILQALEDTRWNRRAAAKKVGMAYSTFRYKLKELGIK